MNASVLRNCPLVFSIGVQNSLKTPWAAGYLVFKSVKYWPDQPITPHFFFLSLVLVQLLVHFGSLSHWKVPLLVRLQLSDRWPHIIFRRSIIWWRIHSRINDCKLPSPGGSKATPKTIPFPPSCFTVGTSRFSWKAVFDLCQTCLLLLWPNSSILNVAIQSALYQKAWSLL